MNKAVLKQKWLEEPPYCFDGHTFPFHALACTEYFAMKRDGVD